MLTELHVKNLALIDEADVLFGRGLNILTGETGAGKSILLGAVNLALGQKFSKDMLRTGRDSALVELVFDVEHESVRKKLLEIGIEPEDGQVIIARRIREGRSVNRINGETCTGKSDTARCGRTAPSSRYVRGRTDRSAARGGERGLPIVPRGHAGAF